VKGSGRPINAHVLSSDSSARDDCHINACGQRMSIVQCAADNSSMSSRSTMQALEMKPIEGENNAAGSRGECQDASVVPATLASFLHGQDFMPQVTQPFNCGIIEVFIRVESRHAPLCLMVATDGLVDFVGMRGGVFPSSSQVLPRQSLNALQNALIGPTEATPLNEAPDFNVRVTYTRFAAVSVWPM